MIVLSIHFDPLYGGTISILVLPLISFPACSLGMNISPSYFACLTLPHSTLTSTSKWVLAAHEDTQAETRETKRGRRMPKSQSAVSFVSLISCLAVDGWFSRKAVVVDGRMDGWVWDGRSRWSAGSIDRYRLLALHRRRRRYSYVTIVSMLLPGLIFEGLRTDETRG